MAALRGTLDRKGDNPMARRSRLAPKVQEDFCAALQIGATIGIAAGYAGIPERTIYDWLERGRIEEERLAQIPPPEPNPDEARYLRFSQAAREAKAGAAVSWLHVLDSAMQADNPGFAMEMLERRYPKDFGKQARVDVTTAGQPLPAPITVVEVVKTYQEGQETKQVEDG